MKIGTAREYIELKELERTPETVQGAGDINLDIQLVLQSFNGHTSGTWLEAPAIKKFLQDLSVLEQSKKGKAVICSMSPKEFILEIESFENPDHMEVTVQLHRYQYSEFDGIKYWPIYLKGGFDGPPETLNQVISCFAHFIM